MDSFVRCKSFKELKPWNPCLNIKGFAEEIFSMNLKDFASFYLTLLPLANC